ncbi:MAG: VWA domain-containing protein [Candidatus Solibacter sp.]
MRALRGQSQDPATFSTGVKVVNLFANVRNKSGAIVKDLTKDEFLLSEDDRSQEIRYFSQESDLPLTLGLLVDTSGSQRRLIEEERSASYRFFEQVLRPEKDVAFVIHFDFDTELLQDITPSRRLLEKALEELEAPTGRQQQRGRKQGGQQSPFPFPGGRGRGGRGGPVPNNGGGGRRGGGTVLYDAVMLASDELMRKQSGRKALIVLSDGVDTGSKVSLSAAVEAAQRADTLVYSILFEDPGMNGGGIVLGRGIGGGDGKKVLQQISRETGGRFFEVSKKSTLAKVYDEIDEDLRHQYSLGYSPDRTEANSAYHRIRLTTRQKGLTVQTREGYYGV